MKDNISRYPNITKDPSTTNFILPQIVLFFIAIVVAESIIMNKYHGRSLRQFDVRDSRAALNTRWQVTVEREGRCRVT